MGGGCKSGGLYCITAGNRCDSVVSTARKVRRFQSGRGADSKRSTGLKSDTSILRLIHFTEIAGVTVDPQILIPYAHIYDAKLGGQGLGSASGFADPIVGATFWVVNQPGAGVSGRYVGITPLVTIPVGEYDKDKGLNVGGNRWVGDLQVGWIEPLGGVSLWSGLVMLSNMATTRMLAMVIKHSSRTTPTKFKLTCVMISILPNVLRWGIARRRG